MKRAALTALTLLLAACASATHTPASSPTKTAISAISARGIYFPAIDIDGKYLIGVDVTPGKYRSPGGTMCHWARLSSLHTSDIIESNKTGDPQVATIRATDTAFLTQNCGTWQLIPAA